MLQDIEDLALGYRNDYCKVFAFGQAHKSVFAFHKSTVADIESDYNDTLSKVE